MTRSGTLAGLVAAVLATGCHEAPSNEQAPAVSVATAAVGPADVSDILNLRGRLVSSPEEDATLAPQVAGRLTDVAVRMGDRVEKGALLASVDRRPTEDAQRTAAAAAAKAREDEAVRVRVAALTATLFEKGISSAEERDSDRAALETARAARVDAEARLAQAARQLSWTDLKAPFTGVVAQVLRHAGEVVDGTGATPVVRLLGTSVQEVSTDATPADLVRVSVNDEASVTVAGSPAPLRGRVVRVARAVDATSGVGEVRVRLQQRSPSPLLSAATVSIVVAVHRGVLAIPVGAIRRSETGAEEVVVVEKGRAKVREVKSGFRSGGSIEILAGLSAGETVVVDSPLGLADGVPLAARTETTGK